MVNIPKSTSYLLKMNAIHLGTNYLWISYESYILPIELLSYNKSSLFLGIIAFIGTALGVFIGLFFGTLSDKYNFGWGRRGPYIMAGAIFIVLSMFLNQLLTITLAGGLLGYIMIQISSNVAVGAYQPLYADILGEDQRGKGSGIGGIFRLLGSMMGYGITGFLIDTPYRQYVIVLITVVVVVTALLSTNTIKKSDLIIKRKKPGITKLFMDMFNLKNGLKNYIYVVVGSFMVFSGVIGLSFFELYFFKYILHYANPAYYVSIAGIVVLITSAFASFVFGVLSDKIGRKKILVYITVIGGIAMILIPEFEKFVYFLILGSIIGMSYGIFMSVSDALASDMAPGEETGKYMGYYNMATGGASSVSPLIYGLILYFSSSYSLGFRYVFYAAGGFFFIGFAMFYKILKD
ncbi:MFS transporter [Ferroplasma acidiphilum]|uniref:MFS transporter n=1 Tax=Ferroplasma acidiphilum TaxID=74969 RepID=UPI0028167579|nr:MFS transporter [Ferroplasma acidiphilum]WMT53869.1 MAG: MFS transporter [Ferroplasma acidiphilum]